MAQAHYGQRQVPVRCADPSFSDASWAELRSTKSQHHALPEPMSIADKASACGPLWEQLGRT